MTAGGFRGNRALQNTILVCDADSGTQVLLFRLLAEAGYGVTSASDGAAAIAKIESDPPALVLANVDLPGKNGVDLCRYVKERPQPIPVVLLAPGTAPEPIEPADAVVGLPIDPMKLLDAMRLLLGGDTDTERPPARVLLVDDDVGILDLLKNLLGTEGYGVEATNCGREGLAAIERQLPDIVLLDVQMPGMTGFEVLAKIREGRPQLPVVMVTGHGSEDVAAEALRLGADDYIAKPLRIRNLCFRVERTLEKARLRAAQERLNQQLRQTTLELADRLSDLVEANSAFRSLLHRVLTDVRDRIERDGAAADTLELLDRLRTIAEADDPTASYDDIAKSLRKNLPEPAAE